VALSSRTGSAKKTTENAAEKTAGKAATAKAPKKSAKDSIKRKTGKEDIAPTRSARSTNVKVVANVDLSAYLPGRKPAEAKKPKVIATTKRAGAKAVRARRPREMLSAAIASAMMGDQFEEDSALERQAAKSQRERDLLSRLSVGVGRSDEIANFEVAADIVFADDTDAMSILTSVLERHDYTYGTDAARVLSEVGTRAPELLMHVSDRLLALVEDSTTPSQRDVLSHAMLALSPLASKFVEPLWEHRDTFWQVLSDVSQPATLAQGGAVRLLAAICAAGPEYSRTLAGGLVDLLGKCMPRDVAFFAESVLPALGTAHSHRAKPVLDRRLKELTPAEIARLRRAQRAAQLGQSVPFAA
jgi:hypothetical protein